MENLKRIRETKNIKQAEVAKYLNISRGSYSRYETGDRNPDPETLRKLSEFFDVSIDYLLGNTDIPLTLTEMRLSKELDNLSDDEVVNNYNLNYDGNPITEEEAKLLLKLIRTIREEKNTKS